MDVDLDRNQPKNSCMSHYWRSIGKMYPIEVAKVQWIATKICDGNHLIATDQQPSMFIAPLRIPAARAQIT